MKQAWAVALGTLIEAFVPSSARAVEFIASAGLLNANDTLTWGQLGAVGTAIPNPIAATSAAGLDVMVSQATGQGNAAAAGAGFGPMYAPGERLYHTGNGFGFSGGPLDFEFVDAISGFGTVCDPNFYLNGFDGTISAYDANDNLLGSFPFSVSADAPYKQVFAGIASATPIIRRVVIDGVQAANYPEDFFIGTALIKADLLFADGFES